MIELIGMHGTDDGQIICNRRKIGQQFRELRSALSMLLEFIRTGQHLGVSLDECEAFLLEDRVRAWFAIEFLENRLGIKQVMLRW